MSRREKWILRRICQRLVRQGFDHQQNMTDFYHTMFVAAELEFSEDNLVTLVDFLRTCFNNAIYP